MPLIDMPLKELEQYQGCTPKPADYDAYWARALEEKNSVETNPTLEPANFTASYAECFDLYFTSTKGARIHAKYLRPKNAKNCPVVLKFHGYRCNSGSWFSHLPFVAQGFAVASMDCRGQSIGSQDVGGIIGDTVHGHVMRGVEDPNPDNLLYRDIFLDTALLADVVASFPETDGTQMMARGGSQGGALSLVCAALSDRVTRVSTQYPFLSDYKRVWDMDLAIDAYNDIREFFRRYDPCHLQEEAFFTKMGYIDIQNLTPRITAKVLFATGLSDNICPPSTQYAVYNKLTCEKKHILYPDFKHEDLPGYDDMEFGFFAHDMDF